MNLATALHAVEFADTIKRDPTGKPSQVKTPAHGAKYARVALVRANLDNMPSIHLHCSCVPMSADADDFPCPGMKENSICYHALAAVLHCAKEAKQTLEFIDKPQAGAIVLVSAQGKGKAYCRLAKK